MIISNVKYYRELPFEEYLAMPGTSFSSLKGEIPESAGMALGTRVHNYLFTPLAYDWQDAHMVRPIAGAIRSFMGDALPVMEKEVAFTADFLHNGLCLAYKGRADLLKIGRIVIDLKILGGSLEAASTRFGYPHQLSGYCLATHSPMALIIAYNKARKAVETKVIKPDVEFWQYVTVSHGRPLNQIS